MGRPLKVGRLHHLSPQVEFAQTILKKEILISQGKKPSLKKNATPLLSTLGEYKNELTELFKL